jgi:predicted nuclease of predicted toxin-antitoxin system
MVERMGPPPHVIWLTCGNTSDARLRDILAASLVDALALVAQGDALVEISDIARR